MRDGSAGPIVGADRPCVRWLVPRQHAWATAIAARRSRSIAAVALARRLAGICFALWRDGTTYRPDTRPE